MKCQSCNIETKMENNNSERNPPKKAVHSTHNLDSLGHAISILYDGRSCNIETTYQPILAVTSTQHIEATSCVKIRDATIGAEELTNISSYQTLSADK